MQYSRSPHTPLPGRSSPRFIWLSIVAAACLLRLGQVGAGLPYLDYIDEGHVLHQAMRVLHHRTWETGLYDYPSLPCYSIVAAATAYSPIYRLRTGRSLRDDLPRHPGNASALDNYYDIVTPTDVIVAGRVVVACLSIATVVLAGAIGRLLGGHGSALLAMCFTALSPALVSRGATVMVDSFATFFTLAALWFAHRLQLCAPPTLTTAWRNAAAAGVAAGLAFASKYPAGAVIAGVLMSIVLLPAAPSCRGWLACAAVVGFGAASVVAMPAFVLTPGAIVDNWRYLRSSYETLASAPYWLSAISPGEIGLPLVLAAAVGFTTMARPRTATFAPALTWLAFAAVLLGGLVWSRFQPFRNVLPLVPLFCIAAAFAIARWHSSARTGNARWTARAAAVLITLALAAPTAKHLYARLSADDTRTTAVEWLQRNTGRDDRILVIRELAIAPQELRTLPQRPEVVSWFDALGAVENGSADYIVAGEFDLTFAPDGARWSEHLARWHEAISPLPVAAAFGAVPCFVDPGVWRTNHQRILILRRAPAR